jgi:hypothetical protein
MRKNLGSLGQLELSDVNSIDINRIAMNLRLCKGALHVAILNLKCCCVLMRFRMHHYLFITRVICGGHFFPFESGRLASNFKVGALHMPLHLPRQLPLAFVFSQEMIPVFAREQLS